MADTTHHQVSIGAADMTRQPLATGALKELLRKRADRILDACTKCGKCVEACPMTPYSAALANADPQAVATGILSLLQGNPGTAEALGWTSVCVRSGQCVPACPENVDPMMMLRIARMVASGGLGGPRQIAVREDRDFFDRIRAFAKLQLTDEELGSWM